MATTLSIEILNLMMSVYVTNCDHRRSLFFLVYQLSLVDVTSTQDAISKSVASV